MLKTAALCAALALATPVAAAQTAWQELTPDVRLRLISSDIRAADGTTKLALELDMPQSYKTYWRVPGESGIPTHIDWTGSTGIGDAIFAWPYPRIETADGFVDFVYRGPTVIPLTLKLDSDKPVIAAAVTMGICSDICVPAQASFSLPLDFSSPDRGDGLRIAQAEALAPIAWTGPENALGAPSFDAKANLLSIPVDDADIDPASLIADSGGAGQLFGAPQKSPDGKLVQLPLLGAAGNTDLAGLPVEITFMTPAGAFSLSKRIEPASTAAGWVI